MPRGVGQPTTAGQWVLLVADSLEAVGFKAVAWLRAHGYPRARLQSPEVRVPWDISIRLWRAGARATRDTALGLHAAAKVPDSAPDISFAVLISSANLREGFEAALRYQHLLSNAGALTFEQRGDHWALGLLSVGDPPLGPHQLAFHMALWCRVCAFITGPDFRPIAVHFEHAAPRDADEYVRAFRCPVFFLQSSNVILLSKETVERPSTFGNARTLATLRDEADRRLTEISGPDWTARVRAALAIRFPKADATLAGIAR